MSTPCRILSIGCALLLPQNAVIAATYTVGPPGSGAQHAQLRDVFTQRNLAPGDIVEVRGDAAYDGGVVVGSDDGGTAGNPVVIRWNRVGASRPVLQGGVHTIKFQQSDHVVFEGFEVRGGSSTCVFSESHDVTVRDAVIHACPAHGILGADRNSGSFTLEYSEVFDAGAGQLKHPIYMQSDEVAHPDAVFRMRYNYIHDGNGGNLLKSRHQRNEIYYNWFENSAYQELELIGPDCETQQPGWTADLKREDSDVVGNVIVHTGSWNNVIRAGGDLNGRSQGRVRLVNNTILIDRAAGNANAVYVQLGLESLEMHNNVIFQTGNAAPAIVRENNSPDTPVCGPTDTRPWVGGVRKVAGSHNWVETAAMLSPAEWGITLRGADPGFEHPAQRRLRPVLASPLIDAGSNQPPAPPTFPFPSPLPLPQYDPPLRAKPAPGDRHPRLPDGSIDVGAFEEFDVDDLEPTLLNGSQPLIPPPDFPSAIAGTTAMPSLAAAPERTARARGRPAVRKWRVDGITDFLPVVQARRISPGHSGSEPSSMPGSGTDDARSPQPIVRSPTSKREDARGRRRVIVKRSPPPAAADRTRGRAPYRASAYGGRFADRCLPP